MKKTIFYSILFCSIFTSCKKSSELPTPLPKANFSWTVLENGNIQFQNKSEASSTYEWNFGDNTSFSNEPNPKHTFKANNTFDVTLTASNKAGSNKKVLKIEINNIIPTAIMNFSLDKLVTPCVLTVNGNNLKESVSIKIISDNKTLIANSSSGVISI